MQHPGNPPSVLNTAKELAETALAGANACKIAEPERWGACPLEVKVERLRQEIREMRDIARMAYRAGERALRYVREHQHSQSGEALVSIRDADLYGNAKDAQSGRIDLLR